MWLIDGNELKKRLLEERDKIPYMRPGAVYEFGIPQRNPHGDSMRGGLRKALRCLEQCTHITDIPAKPSHWEWFEEWNPSTPEHPAECDDCGWRCGSCKVALADVVGGYWDNPDEKPKVNYCPNCGKPMGEDSEEVESEDDWDSYCADKCYECTGYGDDYYTDEDGELVSACDDCSYNRSNWEDD